MASPRKVSDTLRGSFGRFHRQDGAPLAVALEVVLAASPDTVEAGPFNMTLVSAEYDAFVVTGELAFEDVLNEPFPGHSYIPSEYPGLF